MLHSFRGRKPQLAENVFIASGAQVIGDVTIGQGASVWYNAVVRGDISRITIGESTNIQDGTVIHADEGLPTIIGHRVTVGHTCIIHGCQIEDDTLIGMGSTILNGAKVGPGSLVGAGSLLTEGKEYPGGSLIMGRPAKVVRELSPQELERMKQGAVNYQENARLHASEPPLV